MLIIGKTLAHYQITSKIGKGSICDYRVEDAKLSRHVVLKFLRDVLTEDPERMARCERECKLLASKG